MGFGGEEMEGVYEHDSSLAYKQSLLFIVTLKIYFPSLKTASSLFVSRLWVVVIGKLDSH